MITASDTAPAADGAATIAPRDALLGGAPTPLPITFRDRGPEEALMSTADLTEQIESSRNADSLVRYRRRADSSARPGFVQDLGDGLGQSAWILESHHVAGVRDDLEFDSGGFKVIAWAPRLALRTIEIPARHL
jgi:hypothetical protein